MINYVFCIFIIVIAIDLARRELKYIQIYQAEFDIVVLAINLLQQIKKEKKLIPKDVFQQYLIGEKINGKKKTELLKWFSQHIKGEYSSAFEPKQVTEDFILLTYPSILGKPVPRSPVSFAPALLTAIGILGTFSGISIGLSQINLDNIRETQQLIEASTKLLEGMKTSFYTSLCGLFLAIVLIIVLSVGERRRTTFRNGLRKKLSDIAFVETPNRLLSRLDNEENQKVAKTLEKVADNLSGFNAEVIAGAVTSAISTTNSELVQELQLIQQLQNKQIQSLNIESLAQAISEQIKNEIAPLSSQLQHLEKIELLVNNTASLTQLTPEAIANSTTAKVSSLINPITEEIKQLRELQESQGETVESLVKQLRTELIEPVVTRLDQSAALTQQASAAVTELKNELGGVSQSLAGAVERIQTFQDDTLIKLQEFAANLESILAEFRTDTKGVMQQVAVEIQQAVNQSIAGMEAQRTAFEASATTASQTFRGIREDLEGALNTQAKQQKQMLQEVQTSTEAILVQANSAFQNQSDTLVTVGKEASGLMNQAKDNFLSTLSNIDAMLQNTRMTVQQELEQFRLDYQAALQEFFTQQNNLLNDTLGEQRQGLAEVVVNLQQTFSDEAAQRQQMSQQVDHSLERIGETVKIVNNLASAIGMNSSERLGQLQELARTIGNEAQRVEHSYQHMTKEFNESLNNYLKQANETYTESIQDADKAAANVCNKLNETANGLDTTAKGLIGAADFVVTSVKELKNNNGGN